MQQEKIIPLITVEEASVLNSATLNLIGPVPYSYNDEDPYEIVMSDEEEIEHNRSAVKDHQRMMKMFFC